MDVNLLKRYDLVQDVDSLYREILRNCKDRNWYFYNNAGDKWQRWRSIDHLAIDHHRDGDYMICITNDNKWILEKWIYLT